MTALDYMVQAASDSDELLFRAEEPLHGHPAGEGLYFRGVRIGSLHPSSIQPGRWYWYCWLHPHYGDIAENFVAAQKALLDDLARRPQTSLPALLKKEEQS